MLITTITFNNFNGCEDLTNGLIHHLAKTLPEQSLHADQAPRKRRNEAEEKVPISQNPIVSPLPRDTRQAARSNPQDSKPDHADSDT
ncbi:hypothetical protein N7519_000734 [Penicillium mononematosum]|uniref:uncharacterized protein n=1 Tax=Penicillium mononematosum TaxID=268346 RepID=UPI00254690DB|nr:uncharacterized protein N7519_000734 [Penicillium mononematosum]KAJ6190713.1 hypothetical protein N7519_000734 [Penicillium mononematosum]